MVIVVMGVGDGDIGGGDDNGDSDGRDGDEGGGNDKDNDENNKKYQIIDINHTSDTLKPNNIYMYKQKWREHYNYVKNTNHRQNQKKKKNAKS